MATTVTYWGSDALDKAVRREASLNTGASVPPSLSPQLSFSTFPEGPIPSSSEDSIHASASDSLLERWLDDVGALSAGLGRADVAEATGQQERAPSLSVSPIGALSPGVGLHQAWQNLGRTSDVAAPHSPFATTPTRSLELSPPLFATVAVGPPSSTVTPMRSPRDGTPEDVRDLLDADTNPKLEAALLQRRERRAQRRLDREMRRLELLGNSSRSDGNMGWFTFDGDGDTDSAADISITSAGGTRVTPVGRHELARSITDRWCEDASGSRQLADTNRKAARSASRSRPTSACRRAPYSDVSMNGRTSGDRSCWRSSDQPSMLRTHSDRGLREAEASVGRSSSSRRGNGARRSRRQLQAEGEEALELLKRSFSDKGERFGSRRPLAMARSDVSETHSLGGGAFPRSMTLTGAAAAKSPNPFGEDETRSKCVSSVFDPLNDSQPVCSVQEKEAERRCTADECLNLPVSEYILAQDEGSGSQSADTLLPATSSDGSSQDGNLKAGVVGLCPDMADPKEGSGEESCEAPVSCSGRNAEGASPGFARSSSSTGQRIPQVQGLREKPASLHELPPSPLLQSLWKALPRGSLRAGRGGREGVEYGGSLFGDTTSGETTPGLTPDSCRSPFGDKESPVIKREGHRRNLSFQGNIFSGMFQGEDSLKPETPPLSWTPARGSDATPTPESGEEGRRGLTERVMGRQRRREEKRRERKERGADHSRLSVASDKVDASDAQVEDDVSKEWKVADPAVHDDVSGSTQNAEGGRGAGAGPHRCRSGGREVDTEEDVAVGLGEPAAGECAAPGGKQSWYTQLLVRPVKESSTKMPGRRQWRSKSNFLSSLFD